MHYNCEETSCTNSALVLLSCSQKKTMGERINQNCSLFNIHQQTKKVFSLTTTQKIMEWKDKNQT